MFRRIVCTHSGRTKTPAKATGKWRRIFSEGTYRRPTPAVPKRDDQTARLYETVEECGTVARLLLDRKRKNTNSSPRGSTYLRDCPCARGDGKGGIMLILGHVKRVLSVLLTLYTCYVCTCFFSSIKGFAATGFSLFFYPSFHNDSAERRFLLQASPVSPSRRRRFRFHCFSFTGPLPRLFDQNLLHRIAYALTSVIRTRSRG